MSRPLVLAAFSAGLLLAGCLPQYREPRWDEPHAVVKVRLAYHDWPGPSLDQQVTIGQYSEVNLPTPVRTGSGVVTRAVLVRPGNVEWFFRSAFYHYTTATTGSLPERRRCLRAGPVVGIRARVSPTVTICWSTTLRTPRGHR
jgi:hypothetical protein